jgi:hypothetical protein
LKTAVYWAELMNVYSRVISKKFEELHENEGYFDLDRDYITKRTTLTVDEQLEIDAGLAKLDVIYTNQIDPNLIRLDVERLCAILVDDDPEAIKAIQKKSKLKRDDEQAAKKGSLKVQLFGSIIESDADILEAYKDWISMMIESKKLINRKAIEVFQNNLNSYTDSKQVKLKILELAAIHAYVDFAWAKQVYEKDYRGNGTFIGVNQKKTTKIDPNSGF